MTASPAATAATAPADPRVTRSRRAVLEAALELMVERGVANVSVDAIVERSGVAKTTVYRHWPTREALVLDTLASLGDTLAVAVTGDLRSDLVAAATAIARRLGEPPTSVLLPDLMAAAGRDERMRALHEQLLASRSSPVRDLVREAAATGRLPEDTDTDLIVALVVGPLVYRRLVLHQVLSGDDVEQVVDAALTVARSPAGARRPVPRPRRSPTA